MKKAGIITEQDMIKAIKVYYQTLRAMYLTFEDFRNAMEDFIDDETYDRIRKRLTFIKYMIRKLREFDDPDYINKLKQEPEQ